MKDMWSSKVQNCVNMQSRTDDFVVRNEFNFKMIDKLRTTSPRRVKRFRSAFTTEQLSSLEQEFKKCPYIGSAHRKEVAIALNISERSIKIWFQNRRMREKKENTSNEFDDEQSDQKCFEFVKDQSNNDNMITHDQKQYSLPTSANAKEANWDKMMMTNNLPRSLSTGLLIADSGVKTLQSGTTNTIYTPSIFAKSSPPVMLNSYIKSAEFSIDLCKKYKHESSKFMKPLSINEEDLKYAAEQKPMNYNAVEQITPEDLSSRKRIFSTTNQILVQKSAPSNHAYIPVVSTVPPYYTQPYCTVDEVPWEPINVMPSAIPATLMPASVSNGAGSTGPANTLKKCCSCECHDVKPQQQPVGSQYIITTVQFPNARVQKF